jgi:hypothetical protein
MRNKRQYLSIVLNVLISVFLVAGAVWAATTIGSNISTGGTLSVTGASTLTGNVSMSGTLSVTGATSLSTASTTGYISIGGDANNDNDVLYFDTREENLTWDDSPGLFTLSDDLKVTGVTTSTLAFWAGSGGTVDNIDMAGGDLYVQGSIEADGESFLTGGARISTLNATTTNVDALKIFTSVDLPTDSLQWADIGDVPTSTTDQLPEGSTNLYYTDTRVNSVLNATTTLDLTTLEATNFTFGKATSTDSVGYIYLPIVKFEPIATPSPAVTGKCFMDDNDYQLNCYDGTTWHQLW